MKSKYGNAVLMDRAGYPYRSNLKKENKIYWRCRNSERFRCGARAVTDGFYVIAWTGTHTHAPNAIAPKLLGQDLPNVVIKKQSEAEPDED
jgi:hypothetical protein